MSVWILQGADSETGLDGQEASRGNGYEGWRGGDRGRWEIPDAGLVKREGAGGRTWEGDPADTAQF